MTVNTTNTTDDYEFNGDVRGPAAAARELRKCANAFGVGMLQALAKMRHELAELGVDGAPMLLLDQAIDTAVALGASGHGHAQEFERHVQLMRDLIAANPALRGTQKGGWLDPANDH